MSRVIDIGALAELPDPGSRAFAGSALVRAYGDSCPHTGAPLDWSPDTYLDADGELVQCALHGAMFLPHTGEGVHGPCIGNRLTPLRLRGGRVGLLVDNAAE